MRITVRVKPQSSRPRVGGVTNGALVVAVSEPAVDGRATRAALKAVARAFELRPSSATLVSGATARTKIFEVEGAGPERLQELLQSG